MTNGQLHVILATVLDKAGNNRAEAARIMKRYALAQAISVEEQLNDEDALVLAAAAILYDLNDKTLNPDDTEGNPFKPIVIADYVKMILDDVDAPVFEAAAIGSLVAMQKHGTGIENRLHRLLLDIRTLVALDEANATAEEVADALETFSAESTKRRLMLMFSAE
ncbi:MAG: hypothetical protein Q4C56_05245 [Peptococcaceae bacterium]|nr:hypothetical protein [Peptococcaceae bacterium]